MKPIKTPNFVERVINDRVSLYDKYAYFRLAYRRGCGHAGIIISMYSKIPEFLLLIKVFDIPFVFGCIIAVMLMLAEIMVMFGVGHFDLQNKLMNRDVSLANKYNPEMQELLKR